MLSRTARELAGMPDFMRRIPFLFIFDGLVGAVGAVATAGTSMALRLLLPRPATQTATRPLLHEQDTRRLSTAAKATAHLYRWVPRFAVQFPYAEISGNLQPPADGLDGRLGITCIDPRGEGDGYVRNLLWQADGRGRATIR